MGYTFIPYRHDLVVLLRVRRLLVFWGSLHGISVPLLLQAHLLFFTYVYLRIYVYKCILTYVCLQMYTYVCMFTNVYLRMYVYVHILTYVPAHMAGALAPSASAHARALVFTGSYEHS